MNSLEIAEYLEKNRNLLFPNKKYTEEELEQALISLPSAHTHEVTKISMRNPILTQILAVFPGILGVDRFYLGDFIVGLIKYFTGSCLGILWVIDIFTAQNRCRTYNCTRVMKKISQFSSKPSAKKAPASDNTANMNNILGEDIDYSSIDSQISDIASKKDI